MKTESAVITGATEAKRPRDTSIEGLRGLAALTVLFHHVMAASIHGWSPPQWLQWLWPMDSAAAVMVFFVLSGYVIGLTYHQPATGPAVRTYAWRRFVRLMPINIAAVFLGCAASLNTDWPTVLANLFFLQNYTDYCGVRFLVLDTNSNLWSLNYEVVYYTGFVLIWVLRPRLMIAGLLSLTVLLLGWYTRFIPLFLACYAAGFMFWLAGLALAWCAGPAVDEHTNWPSCLLLALVTWKLQGLRLLLSGFHMPGFAGPVVTLYVLDYLPVAIWLLSAVARRSFPFLSAIRRLCLIIPAIGFACHLAKPGSATAADLAWMAGAYALALSLWWWRPSLRFFRWLSPIGLISYALYALSRPVQVMVFRYGEALPANAIGFIICTMFAVLISLGVAWYMERRVQPAIHQLLA